MDNLNQLQKKLIAFIFSSSQEMENVHAQHFADLDINQLLTYRNGTRNRFYRRFNLLFYCTRNFVSKHKSRYWWHNQVENTINSIPQQLNNLMSSSQLILENLKSFPDWLQELAFFELKYCSTLLSQGNFYVHAFSYDTAKWYSNWLKTHEGQNITSKRRTMLFYYEVFSYVQAGPADLTPELLPIEKNSIVNQTYILFKKNAGKPFLFQEIDKNIFDFLQSIQEGHSYKKTIQHLQLDEDKVDVIMKKLKLFNIELNVLQ